MCAPLGAVLNIVTERIDGVGESFTADGLGRHVVSSAQWSWLRWPNEFSRHALTLGPGIRSITRIHLASVPIRKILPAQSGNRSKRTSSPRFVTPSESLAILAT